MNDEMWWVMKCDCYKWQNMMNDEMQLWWVIKCEEWWDVMSDELWWWNVTVMDNHVSADWWWHEPQLNALPDQAARRYNNLYTRFWVVTFSNVNERQPKSVPNYFSLMTYIWQPCKFLTNDPYLTTLSDGQRVTDSVRSANSNTLQHCSS